MFTRSRRAATVLGLSLCALASSKAQTTPGAGQVTTQILNEGGVIFKLVSTAGNVPGYELEFGFSALTIDVTNAAGFGALIDVFGGSPLLFLGSRPNLFGGAVIAPPPGSGGGWGVFYMDGSGGGSGGFNRFFFYEDRTIYTPVTNSCTPLPPIGHYADGRPNFGSPIAPSPDYIDTCVPGSYVEYNFNLRYARLVNFDVMLTTPEPATWLLVATGLGVVAAARRRGCRRQ